MRSRILPDFIMFSPLSSHPQPQSDAPQSDFVWQIAERANPVVLETLGQTLGISNLTATLLANRGVTDIADARAFLDPRLENLHDPFLLPDMEKAVARLHQAVENREIIFLHGDYDADGVTSAAIGVRALQGLGANVSGFVPAREDGYDLQCAGVDRAKAIGASLILTADCGICAVDAVAYARTHDIDVIVTDHHRPGDTLPSACAVVNPYRIDCETNLSFRALCGAAVLFKVLDALMARHHPDLRAAFRKNFVDFAALGTVADVTPLIGENRIFVTEGLRALASGKKAGLRALLSSLKLAGGSLRSSGQQPLTTESISFKIAPRLNAAGRSAHAELAYNLLLCRDNDEAEQLARELEEVSEKTRADTARVTTEALIEAILPEQYGRRVLVLARERWGKGVMGIAATRVAEQMRRPTILLSINPETGDCHGSARGHGGFNLYQALCDSGDLLHRFGGHSQSAGLSLAVANLPALRDRLHELANGVLPDIAPPPTLAIDSETPDGHLWTMPILEEMETLAPFGRENPEPTFVTRGVHVLQSRQIGADGKSASFQFRLPGTRGDIRAFAPNRGPWAAHLESGDDVDIAYSVRRNTWQNRTSVELLLHDLHKPA